MSSESTFTDRTLVVSGGSRGIGLAIALGAAKHGANVVLLAKTAEPHPKLPGTVHTAVADVEAAGGKGVAVVGDVRKEEDVQRAVDAAVEILSRPPAEVTGKCFIDSAVLAETGVTDLSRYGGGDDPILDIFVDKL
jgi:NAD(P)-dependent dehydrogenase (short-subunit alcohol dehydrogenase family)